RDRSAGRVVSRVLQRLGERFDRGSGRRADRGNRLRDGGASGIVYSCFQSGRRELSAAAPRFAESCAIAILVVLSFVLFRGSASASEAGAEGAPIAASACAIAARVESSVVSFSAWASGLTAGAEGAPIAARALAIEARAGLSVVAFNASAS